jgi:hypothetical protein
MKALFISLIICVAAAISCSKSEADKTNSTTLESNAAKGPIGGGGGVVGGTSIPLNGCIIEIKGTDTVQVCFDEVLVDCRCPSNVTCVWAGFASVQLTITVNGTTETHVLSTLGPDTAVVNGYEIKFVDLLPYPKDGVTPDPSDIKVIVTIKKL